MNKADVSFAKANNGNDLVATITSTGEKLTISNGFNTDAGWNVESFKFADGSLSKDQTLLIHQGGAADEMLYGGNGNDTYIVNSAGDKVIEAKNSGTDTVNSSVNYTLTVNVENLVLSGTAAINGTGNTAVNKIIGNSGNNILDGGTGKDILTGGAGQDTFRLSDLSNDTIKDFSVADDTIQLKGGVFTALAVGNLSADNFAMNAAADANDYLIYNSTSGALFYDANGNAAGAVTQIALLGTGLALTAADFVVI